MSLTKRSVFSSFDDYGYGLYDEPLSFRDSHAREENIRFEEGTLGKLKDSITPAALFIFSVSETIQLR